MADSKILRRLITGLAIVAVTLVIQASELLAPADRHLTDLRFELLSRQASGDIVFAAIDKRSLDSIGTWPWPREIHAKVIDRLLDAGAAEVVFDVDFSTPSSPDQDERLAESIERAEGRVVLPAFLQNISVSDSNGTPVLTVPLEMFSQHAWLGTVNVFPDPDGVVRRFPRGQMTDENFLPSIPAMIARSPVEKRDPITVDFGLDTRSIQVISIAEILETSGHAPALEGKTVIVGAYAAELRDIYAVPRHGFLPGAMVQIFAAETEMAGRDLIRLDPFAIALLTLAALMLIFVANRRRNILVSGLSLSCLLVGSEVIAAYVYVKYAVVAPTAIVYLSTIVAFSVEALAASEFFRSMLAELSIESRNTKMLLKEIFRENFDAIVVVDEDGRILHSSKASRDVFGVDLSEPSTGFGNASLLPAQIQLECRDALAAHRKGRDPGATVRQAVVTLADRTERWVEYTIGVVHPKLNGTARKNGRRANAPLVACITARDVTKRRDLESRLRWVSKNDELTRAKRRHAFVDSVKEYLGSGNGTFCGFMVVAINLHRFKTVNVALGRTAGDALLIQVAKRIAGAAGNVEAVARLGGDTFAVLFGRIDDMQDAQAVCEALVEQLRKPYPVIRGECHVGIQAGAIFGARRTAEPIDAEQFLERAESALDEARMIGGSRMVFFDHELDEARIRSHLIERDMWSALEKSQIKLWYQLQVELENRRPTGAEALVRWEHPELGKVGPDEFIPIAEANGLIASLGRWVLDTACKDAAHWPHDLSVSVNVAPHHLVNADIVADVTSALKASGLSPRRLILEIVESERLEISDALLDDIRKLKALGVSIALDDFGTGYSGISYLSKLPFDKIKIDRQFTMSLDESPAARGVIQSMKTLADAFGMTVVCEGVENERQEAFIRTVGCEEAQGYLYGRAKSNEQFEAEVRAAFTASNERPELKSA
jgi:diguanylate cyclase (GGDEF)-like protein